MTRRLLIGILAWPHRAMGSGSPRHTPVMLKTGTAFEDVRAAPDKPGVAVVRHAVQFTRVPAEYLTPAEGV